MYAGFANGYMNRFTYLYQNGNYWSMSPHSFNVGYTSAFEFGQLVAGYADGPLVTGSRDLRPVIKDIMVMMLDN